MSYTFDSLLTLLPPSVPVLSPERPPTAKERKTARELQQRLDKEEEQRRADKYKRAIQHIIHKPTYYVHTWHNINDEPIPQKRHTLSNFTKRNDEFSGHGKARLQTALNWLFFFSDKKRLYSRKGWITKKGTEAHNFSFRLAFITLTLSAKQKHPDEYIKDQMLKPFLHWLTRSHKASYVWKAESQLNGNIHFHITIDTFVHWKSIRAKWNSLLAKEGYCKMFQDGSNDRGDSATQIKAIHNEKGHARTVAGYIIKDSIEEKYNFALKENAKDPKVQHELYFDELSKDWKKKVSLDELLENSEGVSCNIKTKQHHSRFIGGRIWGQSESISNVDVYLSDTSCDVNAVIKEFDLLNHSKNLADVLFTETKEKHRMKTEQERVILGFDDITLKKKFQSFERVWIHKNLKFARIPDALSKALAAEKDKRNFHGQRSWTIDSLF